MSAVGEGPKRGRRKSGETLVDIVKLLLRIIVPNCKPMFIMLDFLLLYITANIYCLIDVLNSTNGCEMISSFYILHLFDY